MDDPLHRAEERIAHLERAVEALSDVVYRQDREIARLTSRIEALSELEAERQAGTLPPPDQRPPHW